jgi:UDPglucose 6-dehydrogenase
VKISVFGLGKLGLPLAAVLAQAGHDVIGVDKSDLAIRSLDVGVSPIDETGLQALLDSLPKGKLTFTNDGERAARLTDVSFVVVPTPSREDGLFDTSYAREAVSAIGRGIRHIDSEHTVILTSTVLPGQSEGEVIPALETAADRRVGNSLNFCYSPEFIALGSVIRDLKFPDMILIGEVTPRSGDVLQRVVSSYVRFDTVPVRRMSVVNAELAKISLNTYVTMKISFANMLSELCEAYAGGNAFTVAEAIGLDARVGSKYILPGAPYGGPCFPRDSVAWSAAAAHRSVPHELAEATKSVNDRQALRVVQHVRRLMKSDDRICVLGQTYKPKTIVTEASAGKGVVNALKAVGIKNVSTFDPVLNGTSLQAALEVNDLFIITTPDPVFAVDFGDKTVIDMWNVAIRAERLVTLGIHS